MIKLDLLQGCKDPSTCANQSMCKSINVMHRINKLKDENHDNLNRCAKSL